MIYQIKIWMFHILTVHNSIYIWTGIPAHFQIDKDIESPHLKKQKQKHLISNPQYYVVHLFIHWQQTPGHAQTQACKLGILSVCQTIHTIATFKAAFTLYFYNLLLKIFNYRQFLWKKLAKMFANAHGCWKYLCLQCCYWNLELF